MYFRRSYFRGIEVPNQILGDCIAVVLWINVNYAYFRTVFSSPSRTLQAKQTVKERCVRFFHEWRRKYDHSANMYTYRYCIITAGFYVKLWSRGNWPIICRNHQIPQTVTFAAQHCSRCGAAKTPSTHHCRACGVCIPDMVRYFAIWHICICIHTPNYVLTLRYIYTYMFRCGWIVYPTSNT